MSWSDVNIAEISTDTDVNLLPEKVDYVAELLPGAKYSQFDSNRIDFAVKVVEGEFKNKRIYGSYPDPEKYEWVVGFFARLKEALKATATPLPGEDPVEFLNRAAGAKIRVQTRHRDTGEGGKKVEVNIGNIKKILKTDE